MALTAYTRFRVGWGLIDFITDADAPAYDSTNTDNTGGDTATLRRCVLQWDRSAYGQDRAVSHLDLVNITAGAVDPTWTGTDFSNVEAALDTWWTAIKSRFHTATKLMDYRWYRLGPGATPPEPVVRVTPRSVAGTGSTNPLPGQVATTISLRTALRSHWGRMYLPNQVYSELDGGGNIGTGSVDAIAGATNTLIGTLASNDFYPMVYSRKFSKAFSVERIVVDNVWDVQRRRRVAKAGYQKEYHA